MKDISIKIRYVYIRYLLIAIGFILLYSTARWYFDYKLGIIHLKEDLLNFWLPFVLPLLPITIWLRREIRILNIRGKSDNGYFLYQFIAAVTIFVPTLIAQEYIEASSSKLENVKSVYEIKEARKIDCYTIKKFAIVKEHAGAYRTSRTSGRHNEYLNFTMYFVVPIIDNSQINDIENYKYWYGIKFTERMSNHASDEKKNEHWRTFYKESIYKFEHYNFQDFEYLQGIPYSDDRDGYLNAIKTTNENVNEKEVIILEPIKELFSAKIGNKFAWIFGSFGIGAFVFFLMVLIPSVNKSEFKRYVEKKPLKEDDLKDIIKFLIPKGDHFTSAILINLNIIVFLYLIFTGVNVISATPKELLELGGNRRYEVLNGEYWRLFTSIFLHNGIMHLFMNLAGIGITTSLIEPIIGRWKTLLAYLITGVGASLMSIYWHENTVSVGASGAIFGMMGIMIALLITKKDNGFGGTYLIILGLYGGISLLFGLLGGIDNAAHIGGLLAGILIGFILILTNGKMINAS